MISEISDKAIGETRFAPGAGKMGLFGETGDERREEARRLWEKGKAPHPFDG
jgi:hypothetical protein